MSKPADPLKHWKASVKRAKQERDLWRDRALAAERDAKVAEREADELRERISALRLHGLER